MKQAVIQIRLSESEKTSIQQAAQFFGETISDFLRQAALLRLKGGKPAQPKDPFLEALYELTKDQVPEKLPPGLQKKINRTRRDRAKGIDNSISIDEARRQLKEHLKRLPEK